MKKVWIHYDADHHCCSYDKQISVKVEESHLDTVLAIFEALRDAGVVIGTGENKLSARLRAQNKTTGLDILALIQEAAHGVNEDFTPVISDLWLLADGSITIFWGGSRDEMCDGDWERIERRVIWKVAQYYSLKNGYSADDEIEVDFWNWE